MPPHRVLPGFLEEATVAALLDYAERRQAAFAPTHVGLFEHRQVDPDYRRSMSARDLGPFRPLFQARVMDRAAELMASLRLSAARTTRLGLELVAHGDGDFYRRHTDIRTAADDIDIRVLSGVYYFHREPKAFDGGALRLYAIGDDAAFVDVPPTHNSLLIFPSWAPHEVRPVRCPSGAFMDSRFSINCWVYAARGAGG